MDLSLKNANLLLKMTNVWLKKTNSFRGASMESSRLQSICIYPIKSTAGINISSSWVDNIGLPFDRRYVVSDNNGQFVTARTCPKLCLIKTNITEIGLVLTAPDMPLLVIEHKTKQQHYQPVTVWGDNIQGQRCHANVDQWFSQYLNKPVQLLYFGEQSSRQVSKSTNPLAFADGYPLLLISQASLDDLNSRLKQPVSMSQFRPNLVVNSCSPFAEDGWRHIRIGEVEFEISKPCARCVFTTVNPETAEKHSQLEPLATLKAYRQVESGDVMFGQNLIPLNNGQVNAGDSVTVIEKQQSISFLPATRRAKPKSNASTVAQPEKQQLTCIKIIDETHDVKTFFFKPSQTTNYIAGQHLPFSLMVNGEKTDAIYTLSSSPTRANFLSITVKRVTGGKVSNYLHDSFKVGGTIEAMPPAGNFHLEQINGDKLLMLSAGSGITPMLSMLKAMVDNGLDNDLYFMHSARSAKDLIAKDEISSLARQHGNCRISYTLTQQTRPSWLGHQGRLNKSMLETIPDIAERHVLVCGPQPFRENAQQLLLSLGVPAERFHYESFGVRKKAAKPTSQPKPQNLNILFDSWDKLVKGNNQQSLLEQGEQAGLILPYSCRGGMCGSCKVKLISGEVKQLADDGLMDSEKSEGYVLACSCVPQSDVVISSS